MNGNGDDRYEVPDNSGKYLSLTDATGQQHTYDMPGNASDSISEKSEQKKKKNLAKTRKTCIKGVFVFTLPMVLLVGFITFAVLFGIEKDIANKKKHILQKQTGDLKNDWKCLKDTPVDCTGLYDRGVLISGVYIICPWKRGETNFRCVQIYCDMERDGGGWTVIQRRNSGEVSFERNWKEYKMGFGDVSTSYWIGNDVIHQLTKEKSSSLYIEITLYNETVMFIEYEFFFISNESTDYRLNISGKATGNLEDRVRNVPSTDIINGAKFSTFDRDNERSATFSCAFDHQGGWWYNSCHDVYLNGPYGSPEWPQPWFPPLSDGSNITNTRMMIRRRKSS